ncbi:hypothetical protein LX36DRAFT_428280 [Colletotrichum falcatum]|nr:hypothetical protein LX36DRAFT_428280 [Colletotrichum falcatum]
MTLECELVRSRAVPGIGPKTFHENVGLGTKGETSSVCGYQSGGLDPLLNFRNGANSPDWRYLASELGVDLIDIVVVPGWRALAALHEEPSPGPTSNDTGRQPCSIVEPTLVQRPGHVRLSVNAP